MRREQTVAVSATAALENGRVIHPGDAYAFFLPHSGVDVTVVDRASIGAGASGVQPGGMRQQWSTEVNCRLAPESVDFYAHLDDELARRRPRYADPRVLA